MKPGVSVQQKQNTKNKKLKWHIFPQSNNIPFSKGREYYADSKKKVLAVADVDKTPLQTLHTLTFMFIFVQKQLLHSFFVW